MAYSYNGVHLAQEELASTVASSSIDTSGADLLVITVGVWASSITVSDSKTNTWTLVRTTNSNSQQYCHTYYSKNPTVGTNHTFTITFTGSPNAATIGVGGFTGADLADPKDQDNGAGAVFENSIATGSITPSVNDCLIWSAYISDRSGGVSNNTSMTEIDDIGAGVSQIFIATAYKIQTTATAINTTWTNGFSGVIRNNGHIVSFKPSTGGGGGGPAPGNSNKFLMLLGLGT